MKISCIVPAYNQAEYLSDAIESVLEQTRKCEIIVINDGSTDNTREIAEKYPVKLINQANKGLASARNTGIMNATGDYILPLDSDDILLETCVEKIEEAIEANHADVIAPSFKQFGASNLEVILSHIPSIEELMVSNYLPYFSAVKKEVLLEVGGYNPRMTWGYEDWDLWIDIFKRNKSLCLLSEPLVLYRTKEHSMLTEANKHSGALHDQMRFNHPELYAPHP